VSDGDPMFGHQAVFVTVLGRHLDEVMEAGAAEGRHELSENVLARLRRTGSLLEEELPG